MRCHICDRPLSETEIAFDKNHDEFDPCTTCLMVISETFDDHLDEDEVTEVLLEEWGDFLSLESIANFSLDNSDET